jgi:tetratricopeptide (TPR) repeat protein
MISATAKFKLPKGLRHIELGKTLVKKKLYFEAFDHFKKSILESQDYAIDILIYLYKRQLHPPYVPELSIIIAKTYMEMNMHTEAFDTFEDTLERHPKNELIYDELSKLITKKTLLPKIKKIFESAIEQKLYFSCIIHILPNIYLEEKNYTKAIELYRHLITVNPEQFSYYKVLSELYFRKRDYESASKILEDLIRIAPYKSEELVAPIQQIIQKIPRHATIRILFANVLFRSFKPNEACLQIDTLIKYHPRKKDTAIQLLQEQQQAFPNHPEILLLLSNLLIDTKQYTESLQHIQLVIQNEHRYSDKCLELMQKIIKVYPKHCLALEIIGQIYFQQENYPQAFLYFNQCVDGCEDPLELGLLELIAPIQENPQEPSQDKAKLISAKIHAKSNNIETARKLITELKNSEEKIDATLLNSQLLEQEQKYTEALSELNQARQHHPYHWNIHHNASTLFNQYSTKNIAYIKTTQPDSPETKLQLGIHLLTNSKIDEAIELLQKIPQTQTAIYETSQRIIARCYFEKSRFDLSDQIFLRIIKQTKNTNNIKECTYWMGLSQLLLSNEDAAIQSFETIETHDRNYLKTQQILSHLRKNKFLNHQGLVLVGCDSQYLHNMPFQCSIRKTNFSVSKNKHTKFEVIGFAQSYNDEGCKQIIKQQFKSGRESFNLAIQMDPKFHITYVNLALLDFIEGNIPSALETILNAETLTLNCPYTYLIKTLCLSKKKDTDQAIHCIQQAIKIQPNDAIFYIILGDLFYNQRHIELAQNYWQRASHHFEYHHWIQQRYRATHFDKISTNYWISPEYLYLK